MVFKVTFLTKRSFGSAIDVESKDTGTKGVDKIRRDLGLQLPLERIASQIKFLRANPEITIEETIARKSTHFEQTNHITVEVEPEALNRYVKQTLYSERSETGEIYKAGLFNEIDHDRIIQDWEKDGFPLKLTSETS